MKLELKKTIVIPAVNMTVFKQDDYFLRLY